MLCTCSHGDGRVPFELFFLQHHYIIFMTSLEEMLVTKASESSESVPFKADFRHGADVQQSGQHKFVEEDPLRLGIQTTGWTESNDLHKDE